MELNEVLQMGTGYIPDTFDERDKVARVSLAVREETTNYDHSFLSVRNQGNEGTCVGFAAAAAKEYFDNVQRGTRDYLSPRFLYSLCKQNDGIPNEEGTYPRVACKMIQKYGIAYENDWPYAPYQQDTPSNLQELYERALPQKIITYARLWNTRDMVTSLIVNGPFIAGVIVTQGWYTEKALNEGVIDATIPARSNDGGHAICITGYDVDKASFRVRNSWSERYGDDGYMWLPREWMDEHCMDAWSFVDDKAIDEGLVIVEPIVERLGF
jgi:C1A family cysteine protease